MCIFQVATDSPIFQDLQGLILKTVGLVDVIRDVLKPLADRIHGLSSTARSRGPTNTRPVTWI
jgi:hypothetical protein